MGSVVKTHEEALAQWVSDEIDFFIGNSYNKLTRSVLTRIVEAINAGEPEFRVRYNNAEHLLTCSLWGELRTALRKHNQVLTTAFLCHYESFIEAAFAVDPPDTLLLIQKQQQAHSDVLSAATLQGYERAH